MKLAMKLTFLATLATLATAWGCAEHTDPNYEFPDAGKVRSYQRVAEIQRSQGSREDANLYAAHFTDDALNSLGRAKVDSMIRNDEAVRPVTIHLAGAGGADNAATMRRIQSITAYLKDNGIPESQMRFETGANAATYHPSAPELANLSKTDTGDAGTAAPIGSSATSAAPSGFGTTGMMSK